MLRRVILLKKSIGEIDLTLKPEKFSLPLFLSKNIKVLGIGLDVRSRTWIDLSFRAIQILT